MSTNPVLGFDELPAASAQPEVYVNNADEILAKRAGGGITIAMPNSDYTLEVNDPATDGDEWPYATIRLTGTLSTTRHLIYPDLDAEYGGPTRPRFLVINDTNRTIHVRCDSSSGSDGVDVAAGGRAFCYYDGFGIVAMPGAVNNPVVIQIACSDLVTELNSGTLTAGYFRAALAMTLRTGSAGVRASVLGASAVGVVRVDVNKNGSTILSTKLTIDQGEKTSLTAATAVVISDTVIAEDDEITIDIDDGGSSAEGLVVTLIGDAA